jgi:hypothetical protein
MRHVRFMAVGLATAVCTAAGIAAAPAMAESGQFHAYYKYGKPTREVSEEKPAHIKGVGHETQAWTFGGSTGYHIVCTNAKATGTMTEPFSETLTLNVHFAKCHVVYKTFPNVNNEYPARFDKEGITLVYHNNGFVEALGGESGEEIEYTEGHKVLLLPVAATWTLPNRVEPACVIALPEQTIPTKAIKEPEGTYSAAVYENVKEPVPPSKYYPEGIKEKLRIINEFKNLKFKFTEGKCAEETSEREGNRGTYSGSWLNEVPTGNLAFEP